MASGWEEYLALLKDQEEVRLDNGAILRLDFRGYPIFELRRDRKDRLWVECTAETIMETLRILLKDVEHSMRYCAKLPCDGIVDAILNEFPCVDRFENVKIQAPELWLAPPRL